MRMCVITHVYDKINERFALHRTSYSLSRDHIVVCIGDGKTLNNFKFRSSFIKNDAFITRKLAKIS
jgi:hypothetical protein